MAEDSITISEINASNNRGDRFYLETHLKNEGKEGFTLTVFDGENAWEGMISEDDLDQQCTKIKMDFETYVKETKTALTQENGADQNFECQFKPTANTAQLSWKKMPTHDIKYHLGSVNLKKCTSPAATICDVFSRCITQVRTLQSQVKSLETDNERLTLDRQNALKRLDKCVTAKEELEKDLYSKFVLVLNSKKERIQLLEDQLQSFNASNSSREENGYRAAAKKTANKNNVTVQQKTESASEDEHINAADDLGSPARKQPKPGSSKKKENEELSLNLSEDEEEQGSKLAPVARRAQRQRATKKEAPSKTTLPRVSSGNSGQRSNSTSGRKSSLRKSGSGTSNKSSDNLDPDDLMDNF